MKPTLIHLTINGRDEHVVVDPLSRLQDVLRDELAMTSVKSGCAQGGCASCGVLVDGEVRLSCLTPVASVEGREITTLEGLHESGAIARLQERFVETYAAQCGFCTSGMLIAAVALLARNPRPSRDEIAEALAGNVCRCTGFSPIIDAIEQAAADGAGEKAA